MDSRLKKHPLGYWEIENKPTVEELERYYSEKYFQEGMGSYELAYSQDELLYFNAKLEQRFAVVKRLLKSSENKLRMLDVGCGEGYALSFFRKQGWSVRGIDFSTAGIISKNPDCLDALINGDIFSLLRSEIIAENTYEVVWLQNVLEHVLSPLDLLKSLQSLVAPGGLLVVTVPNDCSVTQIDALNAKHIDYPFWVGPPAHLSYFDSSSLVNAASHTGWECLELLGDFPIEWFIFHSGSNYVRDPQLGKASHKARVRIENLIHRQPIDNVINFWSALAHIGMGRTITAFLTHLADNKCYE
jgi:2-polyprenyl-3-methyl-5-hydroxy-6-metoxy-1,4-benzoquinol methylase